MAWLSEPRDTEVHRRLVEAVLRRRALLQPTLDEAGGDAPGVLDELSDERAPQRLENTLDEVMARLRCAGLHGKRTGNFPRLLREQGAAW